MAFEKAWTNVPPVPLTADGGAFGQIQVADTTGFKVKGDAYLANNDGVQLAVQINQVLSSTQMIVGRKGSSPTSSARPGGIASGGVIDVSAFTVASGATIGFQTQSKNKIKPDDIEQAVYEADPTVAIREVLVDQYGNFYTDTNPVPVAFEGSISIGAVEVKGTNGNFLEPNPDGSINVVVESVPAPNTSIINTYSEVINLASGSTVSIVTYTVPVGKQAVFQKATFSGENIAKYDLLINNTPQDTARTAFGGDYTGEFNFTTGNDSGFLLAAGDTVQVQVYNFRPSIASFEARVQTLEFPA